MGVDQTAWSLFWNTTYYVLLGALKMESPATIAQVRQAGGAKAGRGGNAEWSSAWGEWLDVAPSTRLAAAVCCFGFLQFCVGDG